MTHLNIQLRLSPARPRHAPRVETYVPDLAQRRIEEVAAKLGVPIEHIVGPASPWQGGHRAIRARQVVAYALQELDRLTYRQIPHALGLKYQTAVQRVRRARRNRPLLEARGGILLRRLSGQFLLGRGNMLISTPDATTSVVPLLPGAVGVEHRFGRSLLAALAFDAAVATDGYHQLAVTRELSWMWY